VYASLFRRVAGSLNWRWPRWWSAGGPP